MCKTESKWLAGGKLLGIGALALFCVLMVLIFIEVYAYSDGRLILSILLIIFIILLYSSIRTWKSISKSINFVDSGLDKKTRISQLNNMFIEDSKMISDFLNGKNLNFSVNTTKRFGITITKFKLDNNKVIVNLQYPMGADWRNNTIEIGGGIISDTYLIEELKNFVDQNII